jgi:hypothetical protein
VSSKGPPTVTGCQHTELKGRLLLDVVVGESAVILKLLAGEGQALLVGRDTLLVLNLGLDIADGVGRQDLEGNGLAGQGLDEDLDTTTQAEDQAEGRFFLDVTAEVLKTCPAPTAEGGEWTH